jgi:hypothetical protein
VSTLAERQLAAWEVIANEWPMWEDTSEQCVLRCKACGKGVLLIHDEAGRIYRWTPEQWRAQIVLHLRNHHADLDPDQ